MILNTVVTVQNGLQEVTFISGDSWKDTLLPAFFQLAGPNVDPTKFPIAAIDSANGQWLQLTQPWPGPSSTALNVQIYTDFTTALSLPLANPGDVNIADLWNSAMGILDNSLQAAGVPLHGPTHVGTGLDPMPLATPQASGALCQLSGLATDYVGGDNICHPLSGLPTGSIIMWPIGAIPVNFIECGGGEYSRTTYFNLWTFLGGVLSPWGQGDGKNTFNSPDLRSRIPMGRGTGLGLSTRSIGQKFGEEAHVTTLNEMPVHAHAYTYDGWSSGGGGVGFQTVTPGPWKLTQAVSARTISQGGGAPHNNIQPSTVLAFIIRV